MKKVILLFMIPTISLALECTDEAYLVHYKSPYNDESKSWCQISKDGKFLKHGPEVTNDGKGNVTTVYYQYNQKIENRADVPLQKEGEADHNPLVIQKIIAKDKLYKRNWPAQYVFVGAAFRADKPRDQLQIEFEQFADELLGEIIKGKTNIVDNLFYDAFSNLDGIDSIQMKSLAKHYLQKIKAKQYGYFFMKPKENGVLYPVYIDFLQAIREGNLDEARKYYLEFGLDPNKEMLNKLAPIMQAAHYPKSTSVLNMMLKNRKTDPNIVLNCYEKPIVCGPDLIRPKCTPLDLASSKEHLELMKILIENGADVNGQKGVTGLSPLTFAGQKYKKKSIDLLLEKGADINLFTGGSRCTTSIGNPISSAMIGIPGTEMLNYFVQKGAQLTEAQPEIFEAAVKSKPVKDHLRHQKNVIEKIQWIKVTSPRYKELIEKSDKPLRLAIEKYLPEVVRFFIDSEMDINQRDENGRTPVFHLFLSIYWANGKKPHDYDESRLNEPEIIKLSRRKTLQVLFDNGGKREIRDNHEKGLLHYATLESPHNDKIIKYLTDKGSY